MNRAARFVPYSSSLPDVLGTASAGTRCARHLRPFCFALVCWINFCAAHRKRFRSHHKVQRGCAFRKPGEKLCGPPKKHVSQVWEQPASRFCAQAQQGQKEEKLMNLNQLSIMGFIGRSAQTK